jgi:hypothetical protein
MNTTQTLEPHYPTLSEVASLLCSVDSVKIPFFCGEDSYWELGQGFTIILIRIDPNHELIQDFYAKYYDF